MSSLKRWIAVLLVAILALGLVACNEKDKDGETEPADEIGFYVNCNGMKIELGKSAESVLTALGEPNSRKEIGDCGGLGAQVRYDYASVTIYVLESKSGEVIDEISLKDDLAETSKGIVIGSKESAVRSAYGDPHKTEGDRLQYQSGDKCLMFTVKDGQVSAIDLVRVTP